VLPLHTHVPLDAPCFLFTITSCALAADRHAFIIGAFRAHILHTPIHVFPRMHVVISRKNEAGCILILLGVQLHLCAHTLLAVQIWHLRPESTFYPKVQFQNALAHIPKGAQVVMLLGEIDCREGLLLAVQKCKVRRVCLWVKLLHNLTDLERSLRFVGGVTYREGRLLAVQKCKVRFVLMGEAASQLGRTRTAPCKVLTGEIAILKC